MCDKGGRNGEEGGEKSDEMRGKEKMGISAGRETTGNGRVSRSVMSVKGNYPIW